MLLSGSETSLTPDTSLPASLTSDPSSISTPTSCAATPNATFSPASGVGASPFAWRDGQTNDLFGQEVAPANRSAWQAKAQLPQTTGIFGLRSSTSSGSAGLQASLASRLPVVLAGRGSTMFSLTWKAQATPQRRQICRLAASARTISANGFGGLPTPTASDSRNRGTVGRTPATTRRQRLGKQIGFSMLFDPMPCHLCVASTMGYQPAWAQCEPMGTPSSRKSPRRSSKPLGIPGPTPTASGNQPKRSALINETTNRGFHNE